MPFLSLIHIFAVLNGDRLETAPASSLASDTQASSAPATDPPPTTASTTAATTGTAESADPPGSVPPEAGDAYFNDAVFIGDSRNEGLMIYGKMPEGLSLIHILRTPDIAAEGCQKIGTAAMGDAVAAALA